MVGFGMLALLAASLVLTSSVVTRYLFKASTDWQDETAVFLLVGATFLCGAFVQSIRGHVGIEALSTLLSQRVDAMRRVASTSSAWPSAPSSRGSRGRCCTRPGSTGRRPRRRGRRRSGFPYLLMALGMTLLALQLVVHLAASVNRARSAMRRGRA